MRSILLLLALSVTMFVAGCAPDESDPALGEETVSTALPEDTVTAHHERETPRSGDASLESRRAARAEARRRLEARGLLLNEEAFTASVRRGDLDVVGLMLDAGMDPAATSPQGESALQLAAARGYVDIVRRLLEGGGGTTGRGAAALGAAAYAGQGDVARTLLEAGVHPDAPGTQGQPALVKAAFSYTERVGMVRLLLDAGADPDGHGPSGSTPLIMAASPGHATIARLLLEAGADLHAANRSGRTALCTAAGGGHAAVTRLLLEAGARPEALCGDGETALTIAEARGRADVVSQLRSATAD